MSIKQKGPKDLKDVCFVGGVKSRRSIGYGSKLRLGAFVVIGTLPRMRQMFGFEDAVDRLP